MLKISIPEHKETKAEKYLGILSLEINELQCAAEAHNIRGQQLLRSINTCRLSYLNLTLKYKSGENNESITCKLVDDQLKNCKVIMERINVL